VHPGRCAHAHLLALAQTHGLPRRRVEEVIDLVGLQASTRREDRSAASGGWPGPTSVAVISGPLVGGGLLELTSWRADRRSPRGLSSAQALPAGVR
jgi:hypothetical protein